MSAYPHIISDQQQTKAIDPMVLPQPGAADTQAVPVSTSTEFRETGLNHERDEHLRVLVVGCGSELREHILREAEQGRWDLREAESGAEALELLLEQQSDVLLCGPHLSDLQHGEFKSLVHRHCAAIKIIDLGSASSADLWRPFVAPAQQPATNPLKLYDLHLNTVHPMLKVTEEIPERGREEWEGMVGSSASMQRVYQAIRLVAKRDTTVLIQGENGTGKDLVARAVHNGSARSKQPYVVINCAAIPEALLEAELFGYTKGAFTGATQGRIGRVHAAHGGTLFLDEIGDMPYALQSKLLRFLEQGEIQRIGGTETLTVNCRVIAATNADLKQQIKANQFREDLYYRLAVFPIALPPLRQRLADLDSLISTFLTTFCPGAKLHPQTRDILLRHDWPGNVRELRNVIERASILADSRREIMPEDIVI